MNIPHKLTRREFLKLSASGALAFALSEMGIDRALAAPSAVADDAFVVAAVPAAECIMENLEPFASPPSARS